MKKKLITLSMHLYKIKPTDSILLFKLDNEEQQLQNETK